MWRKDDREGGDESGDGIFQLHAGKKQTLNDKTVILSKTIQAPHA